MASGDKIYCGQEDRNENQGGAATSIGDLAQKLGIGVEDIEDVMEQVGPDLAKVEAFFRSKENAY